MNELDVTGTIDEQVERAMSMMNDDARCLLKDETACRYVTDDEFEQDEQNGIKPDSMIVCAANAIDKAACKLMLEAGILWHVRDRKFDGFRGAMYSFTDVGLLVHEKIITQVDVPKVVRKKSTKTLRCQLTSEERYERVDQLSFEISEIERLEAEKSSVAQEYAAKIKERQSRVRTLNGIVRSRAEERTVSITIEYRYDDGVVATIRDDTGETVEARPLTNAERQSEFPPEVINPSQADEGDEEDPDEE